MSAAPWVWLGLLAAAFLAVLALGETLARRMSSPPELTRKLDHALAGPVALAVPLVLDSPGQVVALAGSFVAFLLATRLVGHLGSVHGIGRRSVGAYLYPVAIAAAWFATRGRLDWYVIAILALSIADAAGGLAGERWGRHAYRAWGQVKSVEGTLATLGATALISVLVLLASGLPPIEACLAGAFVGAVVALVEGALPFGLDNLGVPLAAVVALAALGSPRDAGLLLVGALVVLGVALAVPVSVPRIRRRPARPHVAPGADW